MAKKTTLPPTLARIKPEYAGLVNYATIDDVSAAAAADRFEEKLEAAEARESRRLDRQKRPINLKENSKWAKFLWEAGFKHAQ